MTARTYPYGYGGTRLTLAEIRRRPDVATLNRQLRRRIFAAMRAAAVEGVDLGIGQGSRSAAQADATFIDRHYVVPTYQPGAIPAWGKWWMLKDGAAPSVPSWMTMHADNASLSDTQPGALGADLVGDVTWLDRFAALFGLVSFRLVNGEIWHYGAAELPAARSKLTAAMFPLKRFRLKLRVAARDAVNTVRLATTARNRPTTPAAPELYNRPAQECHA